MLPVWFEEIVDDGNAVSGLTTHVQTVVDHYASRLHSWDVVNEAVDPDEPDGLRNTR